MAKERVQILIASTQMENKALEFWTPFYRGVWLPFTGERMTFRKTIQSYLQKTLLDPNGVLQVDEKGPHWVSDKKVYLSYAHSMDRGLLVFSTDYILGVDIEYSARELNDQPQKIAERYFHPKECEWLKTKNELGLKEIFLHLWVKKEALGKMNRTGLKESIHINTLELESPKILPVSLTPDRWIAYCCFSTACN